MRRSSLRFASCRSDACAILFLFMTRNFLGIPFANWLLSLTERKSEYLPGGFPLGATSEPLWYVQGDEGAWSVLNVIMLLNAWSRHRIQTTMGRLQVPLLLVLSR